MMPKLLLFAAALLFPTLGATAQDPEQVFRAAVLHKPLVLRDFNGSRDLKETWSNGSLQTRTPPFHAIAAFTTEAVKIKKDHVELTGMRNPLPRPAGAPSLPFMPTRMRITVTIAETDKAQALPILASLLFFADTDEAVAAVPERYSSMAKLLLAEAGAGRPRHNACGCQEAEAASCNPRRRNSDSRPPELIHHVDPEFADEARHLKFSGNANVLLTIGTDGLPTDLWVGHPTGLGLDEKAVEAVSQYVFKPAMCHGVVSAVSISVDVNFTIF